jgi:hypothetical protein
MMCGFSIHIASQSFVAIWVVEGSLQVEFKLTWIMKAENLKSLKWIRDVLLKDRTCIADLYSHSGILCVGDVVEHGNG